jgi:Na+/H+ antiporter NhaD/arsenite permease-like protein
MSNVGGTATMVGDPPNLIIGNGLSNVLGFMDFIVHLAPGQAGRGGVGGVVLR